MVKNEFCQMKSRFGRTIRQGLAFLQSERHALADPSGAIFFLRLRSKKTPPPVRPSVNFLVPARFFTSRNAVGEKLRVDKRHGGRADANVAAGGERRPTRHGVKVSLKINRCLTPIKLVSDPN